MYVVSAADTVEVIEGASRVKRTGVRNIWECVGADALDGKQVAPMARKSFLPITKSHNTLFYIPSLSLSRSLPLSHTYAHTYRKAR